MNYLKERCFRYLCVSWGRNDDDPFYFGVFKHKGVKFFWPYSKVIDITFFGRRLVLEF